MSPDALTTGDGRGFVPHKRTGIGFLQGCLGWGCLALAPLALAGCMVGPDYVAPAAPVAANWLQSRDPAVRMDRQDERNWWSVYRDPVLDRLIQTAYDQNLSLMSAGTRVLAARAQLGIAAGEFYPQTQQLGAGISYNQASSSDPTGNPNANLGNFWRSSLGAQIAWELDFWGKFRRGIESADAAYLASIASYDDVLVTLIGDVATSYIGIRTLERQIAIAGANVTRQQKALAIARARFEGGTSTKLDVYQAENVLAATQATIPQLTSQMEQGKNALRVLLGMPPETLDAMLAGPPGYRPVIPVPPAQIAAGIPADIVRRRPDLRAAELRAAAQSAQIGMARADLYPAFILTGSFGTIGSSIGHSSLDDVFTSKGIAFSFGPSFQWPVLNYGQITNNVRVQDAKLQSLLIDYQQSVLRAQREVEDGLAAYVGTGQQVAKLRLSEIAAAKALGIALEQYPPGHPRLHHGPDRGTESLHGGEQPRGRRRQLLDVADDRVSRPRRRVADPRGAGIRSRGESRADAAANRLGRPAAAGRHAGNPGSGPAIGDRREIEHTGTAMVRSA